MDIIGDLQIHTRLYKYLYRGISSIILCLKKERQD